MLMEIMGLQLPGSSFVNPGTPLREALNEEAVKTVIGLINAGSFDGTLANIVTEKTIVNAYTLLPSLEQLELLLIGTIFQIYQK